MLRTSMIVLLTAALVGLGPSACSTREIIGGAAVGGAAYEYSNKRAMDELRDDYKSGRISNEEYDRRKKEIEGRSLVY